MRKILKSKSTAWYILAPQDTICSQLLREQQLISLARQTLHTRVQYFLVLHCKEATAVFFFMTQAVDTLWYQKADVQPARLNTLTLLHLKATQTAQLTQQQPWDMERQSLQDTWPQI